MKRKAIWFVSYLVVLSLALIIAGCGTSPERQAEIQALNFVEGITGAKYFPENLDIEKTITGPHEATGLKDGESRWRVQGTVGHGTTKDKYTVRIFVDEIEHGERWRLESILKGPGVDVPVGRLEKVYP